MEAITLSHVRIPSINIGGICLPGIGAPGSIGKKGLIWPTGMKEHIKAWYDPKKQGMTNFDVIEAYVEDFTNWNYVKARGVATISQHKFIITECILKGLSIVEDIQEPYSNLTVRIIGITDNQEVLITDYVNGQHQIINTITEDGIYTIEDRHHFVGFGCNFVGTCNITIEQLPTSILKDLSGNGNHAYLYGGKGKLNSGMGVYQTDFSSWNYYPSLSTVEYSPKGLVIKKVNSTAQFCASDFVGKFTAEVSGIPEGVSFYYRYIDKTTGSPVSTTLSNGINEIDCSNANGDANMTNMFLIGADNKDINITITQIPDYPDQLCYDGKMYAVCYGFPILTDYTVMAERTWFENNGNRVFITKGNIWPNCAFVFEKINASLDSETFSFSKSTRIDDLRSKSGVTYQTKQSYNGVPIAVGDSSDGDVLLIGGQKSGEYIGCHSAIIVADRSFTEEEINWLKQNWDKI
jgi:hypothetical protein